MSPKSIKRPKGKAANPTKKNSARSTAKKLPTSTNNTMLVALPMETTGGLTLLAAQVIVVKNTPRPNRFNGDPDQLLKDLGILGDNEVDGHKAGIVHDIEVANMTIDEKDIISGPGVDVATCRDSVFNNAQ